MTDEIDDPLLFTLFNEIGIISQLSNAAFEKVLPDGLKVSHFSVLNHLARLGDNKSPSSLASAFQVTKGAMTNTLGRLEARGLVKVKADPVDGRGKRVFITAKGRKARNRSIAELAPLLTELAKALPEKKAAAALPFLKDLRVYLDQARD